MANRLEEAPVPTMTSPAWLQWLHWEVKHDSRACTEALLDQVHTRGSWRRLKCSEYVPLMLPIVLMITT